MAPRRNYRRKPAARKPRKYGRKSYLKPKKNFVKAVKAIIHKQTESKMASLSYPLTYFNSDALSQADVIKVLPDIVQGTDNAQRIGDDVTSQKLTLKGHFLLARITGAGQSRIGVRMIVCCPKRYPIYTDAYGQFGNWINSVLMKGTTEIGLNGTIESLYLPINTNSITCYYDKVTYITQPYQLPITNATSTSDNEDLTNSCKFFSKTITLKKKLKYDNVSPTNQPTNWSPVLLCSYVKLDGSTPDSLNTNLLMSFVSTLQYEDA